MKKKIEGMRSGVMLVVASHRTWFIVLAVGPLDFNKSVL